MPARSIDYVLKNGSLGAASRVFKFSLSTIESPAFSQVTILYRGIDFHAIVDRYPAAGTRYRWTNASREVEEASFDAFFPEPLVTHTFFQIEPPMW